MTFVTNTIVSSCRQLKLRSHHELAVRSSRQLLEYMDGCCQALTTGHKFLHLLQQRCKLWNCVELQHAY